MVKSPPRRRARLRSSQYASERWKPSPAVAVVLVGLILGVGLGAVGKSFDQSASLQEHYLLLVSDLYAAGVPVDNVRQRLVQVGYTNPSVAVVGVADQLGSSTDTGKKQEASQLHSFAEALAASTAADVNPTITARATATPPVDSTPTALSTVAPLVAPDVALATPVATPGDVAAPPAAPATDSTAPPAPTAAPVAPALSIAGGKTGVVRTSDRQPVFYRKEPTSKSTKVGILPYGSTVTILGTVTGEAVNPGSKAWYHISVGGHDGYIYAQFVQAGG